MKRIVLIVIIIAAAIVLYVAENYSTTIDYRGESFKMRKGYWSYEDYKDDPNNLNTNDLERIEAVMVGAKISSTFKTKEEFSHTLFGLKFPGYGLGGIANVQTDDGSTLDIESVEIPLRDKDRYLVVRESPDQLILLDDFISNTATNLITHVKLQEGKIFYYDDKNSIVREKDILTK